jgi:O-antigen/teichoic acid export membrane protein
VTARQVSSRVFLARNSAFAILTVASSAISLFTVYRLTAASIGVSVLGIWSVSFSLMSLTGVADLGLPLAMVREIARMRSVGDWAGIPRLILRSTFYTCAATLVLALLLAPSVGWIVERLVLKGKGDISNIFLVGCACAVTLTSVSSVLTGALEGIERYDLKFASLLFGNIVLVATAHKLVRSFGADGLAWSFAAQLVSVAVTSALALAVYLPRKHSVGVGEIELSPVRPLGRAIRIGFPLRVAGLASFFFEPAARFLIGIFGGASSVGIYEAASRLCIQSNALVSGALQVLVPRLTVLAAKNGVGHKALLVLASKLTSVAALLGFTALGLSATTISLLLLSRVDTDFVSLVIVLGAAWMLHLLAAPTYFANIADGSVSWNWISQWLAVVVSALVGSISGMMFGWRAVVAGPVCGLLVATTTAIMARRRRTKEAVLFVAKSESVSILLVGIALAGLQIASGGLLGPARSRWLNATTLALYCVFSLIFVITMLRRMLPNRGAD